MADEFTEHRDLYVPRELVFDAWTEPDQLSAWYVTGAASLERLEVDPVAGGIWQVAWNDASGRYAEAGQFTSLLRPEHIDLQLRLGDADREDPVTRLNLRLVNLGGACRVELRHRFALPGQQERYGSLWPQRLDALLDYFSVI